MLNAQGEPITPLIINDFNEFDFNALDELQIEQQDSID